MDCRCCATCCTAPDISTLAKPIGVPCRFLNSEGACSIYSQRPDVCRNYQPDEICERIAAPTLDDRVNNYLRIFLLHNEK